ncbi:hypothetical protein ABTX81_39335 [Kitasatospora sp. NPDC097605]|uniref:hypothetical protein n=1 Tax=Kitasatospora sp. NPDC097605 TaxID=3157226 RepID=UPI00332E7440
MPKRPTDLWREHIAEEAAAVAAGTLDPECAYSAALFPASLLTVTDDVLAAFEADVAALGAGPADNDVLGVVERVVLELNRVHEAHDEAAYETDERELLCAYIDDSLVAAGVDVVAFAERQGLGRHEITDRWRDW